MNHTRIIHFGVASALFVSLMAPAIASTSPTFKAVPKSATMSKQMIPFTPGMQQAAFHAGGMTSKKQFVASLHLSSTKAKP